MWDLSSQLMGRWISMQSELYLLRRLWTKLWTGRISKLRLEKENSWIFQQYSKNNKWCVTLRPCHFTFKSMLRQKKNYGNSNISPCKNIILKNSTKRNQNPLRYYNSITNLKFQHKPKYHLSKYSYKSRPIT